jgi:hypothetical protein
MSIRDSEHFDDSHDMIERIRKLRETAEEKMNLFGDPAEYDVRIIRGRESVPAEKRKASIAKGSGAEGAQ